MKALLDSVRWQARDHPFRSRGLEAAGAADPGRGPEGATERSEECRVLTRNPRVLFVSLPRTKVFHPEHPAPWVILWWRTVDDPLLAELHHTCLRVCSEVGPSEFCLMCHARGPAAARYWREMLGDKFGHLRWRS
jgi:hypothetical protein